MTDRAKLLELAERCEAANGAEALTILTDAISNLYICDTIYEGDCEYRGSAVTGLDDLRAILIAIASAALRAQGEMS